MTPSEECCTFSAGDFTVDSGIAATFQNDTMTTHDVSSSQRGPDGKPLFYSPQINSKSAPINGTQYLAPGEYPFVCTIHAGMKSNLTILPGATPQARPSATVAIAGQRLAAVKRRGRVTVVLRGRVAASGVILFVKRGRRILGTVRNVRVAGRQRRVLGIPLTRSGKRTLTNLNATALTVQAVVPFGRTVRSSRRLR